MKDSGLIDYTYFMELALNRLRMLREVALRGSVTAAAEALGYSASGVSQQIAALEREVATELLEPVGRGVRLTEVGRVLAEQAGLVLDAEAAACAAVEAARDSDGGELRVGLFSTVAAGLLPGVIAELGIDHPGLRIESREVDPEHAPADLRVGRLDLAFLIDYPEAKEAWPSSMEIIPIGVEELRVAAPAGLLNGRQVRLADLAEMDWIISGSETYYGRAVRIACTRAGFEPQVRHQVDEQGTAMAMVAAGLGVTLVSELGEIFRPANVELFPLRPRLTRQLLLAHPPGARARPTVRAFVATTARVHAAQQAARTSDQSSPVVVPNAQ